MDAQKEVQKFKLSTLFFMIGCILRASPVLFPLMVLLTIMSIGVSAYALFMLRDATNGIVDMLAGNVGITGIGPGLFVFDPFRCS